MAMLGQAQKEAASAVAADLEGAREHARAWEVLATATVARGEGAATAVDTTRRAALLSNDEALYRSEVQRAAALHTRREARRFSASSTSHLHNPRSSSSAHPPPGGGGGSGDGDGAAAAGDRYGKPTLHVPPRESPFYGPYGVDGAEHLTLPGAGVVIASALPRVPQVGPPDLSSVIRVPVVTERATMALDQGAAAAAAAASRELEARRAVEGELAATRTRNAGRRGSGAGRQAREAREGLALLHDLERLHAEDRLLATRRAASAAAANLSSSSSGAGGASSPFSFLARSRSGSVAAGGGGSRGGRGGEGEQDGMALADAAGRDAPGLGDADADEEAARAARLFAALAHHDDDDQGPQQPRTDAKKGGGGLATTKKGGGSSAIAIAQARARAAAAANAAATGGGHWDLEEVQRDDAEGEEAERHVETALHDAERDAREAHRRQQEAEAAAEAAEAVLSSVGRRGEKGGWESTARGGGAGFARAAANPQASEEELAEAFEDAVLGGRRG
jgi:hypothetical protein